MKYAAFLVVLGAICFAGEPQRPACTAKTHGRFWPEEANADPNAARQLAQKGELEICALGVWRYRWELLSVNVHNLTRNSHPSAPKAEKPAAEENK